jgi:hypothetical protein
MQNNLFGEHLATPPAASRSRKAAEPEQGPPRFALFQARLRRWTNQTQTFAVADAAAANAWFESRELPLVWRPIAEKKTYTIRR